MSLIRELLKQRDVQDRRANDAAERGFPDTARTARAEAARLERRIRAEQDADGTWTSEAHP